MGYIQGLWRTVLLSHISVFSLSKSFDNICVDVVKRCFFNNYVSTSTFQSRFYVLRHKSDDIDSQMLLRVFMEFLFFPCLKHTEDRRRISCVVSCVVTGNTHFFPSSKCAFPGWYIHRCYYSLTDYLTEVTTAVRLGCIKTLPVQRLAEPFMPRYAVFKPSERPQPRD